jgi:hypothetical protein
MKLQPASEHPHGLTDRDFDALFTTDKPIIFRAAWLSRKGTCDLDVQIRVISSVFGIEEGWANPAPTFKQRPLARLDLFPACSTARLPQGRHSVTIAICSSVLQHVMARGIVQQRVT